MNVVFDSAGVLRQPELHDGSLLGISVSAATPKTATLTVADVQGRRYTIHLSDVERLRAQDFCEGNTIFDLTLLPVAACPSPVLETLYGLRGDQAGADFLDRVRENPDLRVLVLSSSYGCSLVALFRELAVVEDSG